MGLAKQPHPQEQGASSAPCASFAASDADFDLDTDTVIGDDEEERPAAGPIRSTPFRVSTTSAASELFSSGFRRGVTTARLLPIAAPVQRRNYRTPSATARRDPPVVAAAPSATASTSTSGSPVSDPPPADVRKKIETRRFQNTVSARRGRQRQYQKKEALEADIAYQRERGDKAEAELVQTMEEIAALKGALNRRARERETIEKGTENSGDGTGQTRV